MIETQHKNETQHKLAPGIHDNHGLTLWHEWMALTAHHRLLEAEWKYERTKVAFSSPDQVSVCRGSCGILPPRPSGMRGLGSS